MSMMEVEVRRSATKALLIRQRPGLVEYIVRNEEASTRDSFKSPKQTWITSRTRFGACWKGLGSLMRWILHHLFLLFALYLFFRWMQPQLHAWLPLEMSWMRIGFAAGDEWSMPSPSISSASSSSSFSLLASRFFIIRNMTLYHEYVPLHYANTTLLSFLDHLVRRLSQLSFFSRRSSESESTWPREGSLNVPPSSHDQRQRIELVRERKEGKDSKEEDDDPMKRDGLRDWFFFLSISMSLGAHYLRRYHFRVKEERLLVMTGLGLQMDTLYRSGRQESRFLAMEALSGPFLVEFIQRFQVRYGLVMGVRHADHLFVLFEKSQPDKAMLLDILKDIRLG